MKDVLRAALAVPALKVADVSFNTAQIQKRIDEAAEKGATLVAFPELSLTGASCGDLFLSDLLCARAAEAICELASAVPAQMTVVVGAPLAVGGQIYNCAVVLGENQIHGAVAKGFLSAKNGEERHFACGADLSGTLASIGCFTFPVSNELLFCAKDGTKLALTFGEDESAPISAAALAAMAGAEIVVELGAENAQIGAREARRTRLLATSENAVCALLRVSAGKDESTADLVYAGEAMMALNGSMIAENACVADGDYLLVSDLDLGRVRYDRRHNRTFAVACARFASEYENVNCDGAACGSDGKLLPLSRLPFIPDSAKEREARAAEIFEIQATGLARRLSVVGGKLVIGISGGLDSTLAVLVAVRAMKKLGLPTTNVTAVTMPCFGTTDETLNNALELMATLGVTTRTVSIKDAVLQHFKDIGHDPTDFSVTYENAQARERTQVLMDIANQVGGIVLGTGDLSELALGWCTYNGDHMSMYGVNADVPKTLVRWVITALAETTEFAASAAVLKRILDTPISPELLPPDAVGKIAQKTEDIVGPYALHDFFLFFAVRYQYTPTKLFELAQIAFAGVFDGAVIKKWLTVFWRRFFNQQFKRNCLPDGVKVGSVGLSPRGDWQMPSDASAALWLQEIDNLDV